MKPYVITTGTVFGLIVVAHIWRAVVEGPGIAKDPVYIILTVVAASGDQGATEVIEERVGEDGSDHGAEPASGVTAPTETTRLSRYRVSRTDEQGLAASDEGAGGAGHR